ncbi:MAG: flagellar biosynthesis protein FliQ [Gammaproteobacteria bacterium]|nr:flagellar biosynthesis protein FliQ [Gammaproteobacteria bacterium]
MTPESVLDIFQGTIQITLLLLGIILLPALVVGIAVSMFQAATQINEMTLSFIPKLLVTLATLTFAGPYMLAQLADYITRMFHDIPYLIG